MEPMKFSLDTIQIPVEIGDKEFVLREASGDTACKFTNARMACGQMGPDNTIASWRNIADTEPLLVSLCLFEIERGEDGSITQEKPTQISQIRKWPSRITKELYDKAKEISDIDTNDDLESLLKQRTEIDEQIEKLQKKDETAKKPETDTTDGSS